MSACKIALSYCQEFHAMILVIGQKNDAVSMTVAQKIDGRGGQVLFWETKDFPATTLVDFNPFDPAQSRFQLNPASPIIAVGDITAVFRRWAIDVTVPPEETDAQMIQNVFYNNKTTLYSFFRCLECLQVNRPESHDLHDFKPFQLKLMQQCGIRVPDTLISNNSEAARAFFDRHQGNVVMKNVGRGAYTQMVTRDLFSPDHGKTLLRMPIKFQEHIPGTDIRVYIVDRDLFAVEIGGGLLDFRTDGYPPRKGIELPAAVQEDCFRIADLFGLLYTGIDLRRTPEGEYVFFEANPCPIFIFDEMVTEYPISGRIVKLLMSGDASRNKFPQVSCP